MELVFIDHYDSFSFNVIDWLQRSPHVTRVHYCAYDDEWAVQQVECLGLPLIVSPGPKHPKDAGSTLALLKRRLGKIPILGICLGHQALACATGAHLHRSVATLHGAVKTISPLREELFQGFPRTFRAASYNSLVIDEESLPPVWQVLGRCERGEIQAIGLRIEGRAPAFGVQFHPESFLTEEAGRLLDNWTRIASSWLDGHVTETGEPSLASPWALETGELYGR